MKITDKKYTLKPKSQIFNKVCFVAQRAELLASQ